MKAVIFGNTCRSEVAACTHKLLAALARHDVEMLMERDFLVFLRSMGVPIDLFISEKNLIDYRDIYGDDTAANLRFTMYGNEFAVLDRVIAALKYVLLIAAGYMKSV